MTQIEVKNLVYTYGKGTPFVNHAVNGISFCVNGGEIVGIIGHTGSGKSTIVQQLNGLLKPEKGEVLLNGKNIWTEYEKISDIRFKVGLVFQYPEYQLFEETVYDDIAFGPKNMGLSEEEIKKRVEYSAGLVDIEPELMKKSPFDLSGGQKRRVAIAGIIAMQPEVLVLDEPTAGLDPKGRDLILSRINEYRKTTGAAVLIVSHSMEDMAKVADKLLVLNKGKVEMFDTVGNVFSKAERLEEIGLDIPGITRVAIELNKKGFNIPKNLFTVDEVMNHVLALKRGGAVND